ncbi:VCBS domain-containing protein, partial [Vibrio artabrorum]|uniref:VCBS domain-containing protein n=1 Tax=Vibrio artabrorum TaxID=446374 RepID=UPI003552516A
NSPYHYNSVDNSISGVQNLATGAVHNDTFTVESIDGTTQVIDIETQGDNDKPEFWRALGPGEVHVYNTVVAGTKGPEDSFYLQRDVHDKDGDQLTWSVTNRQNIAHGTLTVTQGKISFKLDDQDPVVIALTQSGGTISAGQFTIEVSDGHGGTATKVIPIYIHGA